MTSRGGLYTVRNSVLAFGLNLFNHFNIIVSNFSYYQSDFI